MHILLVIFKDGAVEFIGPFPTYFRANEYATTIIAEGRVDRTVIRPMIIPYAVVQKVEWR